MDLYAALKSGSTADELEETFKRQLNEAVTLIKEEEEAAKHKEDKAAILRQKFADAAVEYFNEIFPEEMTEDDTFNTEYFLDIVKKIEKQLKTIFNLYSDVFTKNEKSTTKTTASDDAVIKAFLKTL